MLLENFSVTGLAIEGFNNDTDSNRYQYINQYDYKQGKLFSKSKGEHSEKEFCSRG